MYQLSGSMPALATPFKNGQIDEKAFANFIDWQIKEGSSAVVACGTTGEAPTLTDDEQDRVIQIAVETVAKRVPVIAGTGSNDTAHVVGRIRSAEKLGADFSLVVTPYYNKPTQEGLYQHFKAVHDAANLPLLVYNIPGRSIVDMQPTTLQRLSQLPRIVGVKDATNDLARPVRTRLDCGDDFIQLSGEDGTASAFLAQGGTGCISVSANVAPRLCAAMQTAWVKKDFIRFNELRDMLMPLHQVLFIETSPAPVKYALSLLGLMGEELRLPLVPCMQSTKAQVAEVLQHLKLVQTKAA